LAAKDLYWQSQHSIPDVGESGNGSQTAIGAAVDGADGVY
jgi:hypothetical protein